MDTRLLAGLDLLGIDPNSVIDSGPAVREIERRLGRRLPASCVDLVRFPGLMESLAEGIGGHAASADELQLNDSSYMPDVREPVMWILWENQGVVVWGVPLERGDDPPVLVGYGRSDEEPTVEYARSVADFVFAMAWDGQEMPQERLLMAQAQALDRVTLQRLRSRYREVIETRGWPAHNQYRLEGEDGLRITLWSGDRQCDWWVTAADLDALSREAAWLLGLSDLRVSFWSNDMLLEAMLAKLRG